jgi:uncharacterized paraquat-inducible protein A
VSALYTGPQCPICDAPLDAATLRPGTATCPMCDGTFEATPFQPREMRIEAVQAVTQTPEGLTAACANHPGNAAVTSCQRCGLFVCALCDMNVGQGSYCPSCFDRIRTGAVETDARYRDYAAMATSVAVFGLFCNIVPLGIFALIWGAKGIRQRRTEGLGIGGVVAAMVLGGLETLGFVGSVIWIIVAIAKA